MSRNDRKRGGVEEHLSLADAAERMGISERTARRWIKSGKLRAYKPGRDYWIPESALTELVEESKVHPKAPTSSQPSFNGLLEEEQRDYGSHVWERINLLDAAAEQWQRFVDEGLYDLEKLDFKLLKVVDRVSMEIVLNHGREAAAMKRGSTDEVRARLEQAERRLIDNILEFWGRVEKERELRKVTNLDAFKAQREEWEQVKRSSRTA
jgi:excisionase family DNA binding protein